MNDGGIWGIPRANSVWRFDKTNKVLIQIYGEFNEPDNVAIRTIAPIIGYRTEYKPENLTQTQVTAAMMGAGKMTERPVLPVTKI